MKAIAAFSGLSAVSGLYLCFDSDNAATIVIGLAIALSGIASALICFMISHRRKKSILDLQRQLMEFLEGRIKSPAFSVDDNDFSMFENAVIELETRLLLEQDNTQKTSRRNADFIADVSHQLKTPLAGLKLYCEMDGGSPTDAHAAQQLALIEHMESLIYSLLRLEKLRADAYEMDFKACSLMQIICEAREALIALYPEKDICVSGEAVMRCDSYWIREAVSNIIKNACEHTRTNGSIRIRIENSDTSVMLFFEDNGGGVAINELPELFKRFSHVGVRPETGSAGLGLSITKAIVDKHHGTIYAENASQGLRVILCFPILDGIQLL